MRNTRPRPPAQARLNTATESSIAVYDGATRSIIECGSEHHAWHHHRQAHLGAFKTRTEAMR
jgi:hypothetical protein